MDVMVDHRWTGQHGIGRFADEVIRRLPEARRIPSDRAPLHPMNAIDVARILRRERPDVYFTPSFNPPRTSPVPFVFCIHDLIHLHCPDEASLMKRLYYTTVIRPAGAAAARVLTVSEHSRQAILNWSGWPADKVSVVGNGVGGAFKPEGPAAQAGYPYLLHVGNHKPHKNIDRLLRAFASTTIDPQIRLVFVGDAARDEQRRVNELRLGDRVIYRRALDDAGLAAMYRGALAVVLPSLHEGFGLPALEAMACGTPVACSNCTALPEVVGDAAVTFDPTDIADIAQAIEAVITQGEGRLLFQNRGLERAGLFSWDKTGQQIREILAQSAAARVIT